MEQARRKSEIEGEDPLARFRGRDVPDAVEKVVRFALPARELEGEAGRERSQVTARDIVHAVQALHAAGQTMKASEERAREGDARTQALLQRATEELRSAEGRVQAAEARARAAETRAQETESRLREAETWLRQIFAAIAEELPQER